MTDSTESAGASGSGFRVAGSTRLATAGVMATALAMGLMPVFAKELTTSGMSAVAVTFYRALVGLIVASFVMRVDLAKRGAYLWSLAGGFGLGLGWSSYVYALDVVPVSTASVLYMSYPVFAIGFAWAMFSERPHRRAVLGAALVLSASVLALGPEFGGDQTSRLLLMLLAPVSFGFAVAVIVGKVSTLRPIERVGAFSVGSMTALAPIMATQSASQALPSDLREVALLAGMGLLCGVGPQWLYTHCAPRVGAARAAIAGAMELPTMFVMSAVVFDEMLTVPQAVAGLIVVAAILAVPSRPGPATLLVRRRRRLIPGRFYKT